jgi:hypothetical protein
MTNEEYIDWLGKSGQTYRYWFIMDPTAAGIKATAGNYAFVKQLPNGNFTPLYFGESEDVQSRIPGYDRWEVARRVGVTHVMGHTSPVGVVARLAEERDLIQQWHPLLNTQPPQTLFDAPGEGGGAHSSLPPQPVFGAFAKSIPRTWVRFSPQIMCGIMRAVGAIMRSPNMDRRF